MNEIRILVGVPGSGKTTIAKELLKKNPNLVKVSRDDIRKSLKDSYVVDEKTEKLVSSIQDSMIRVALVNETDVVLDNTNCKAKYIKETIEKFGKEARIVLQVVGAELSIKEIKEQNKRRDPDKVVPEEVIDRMYNGFINVCKEKDNLLKLINSTIGSTYLSSKVKQDIKLPKAILVDIDGTVAHMHNRSPYDWHKVGDDTPDLNVLNIVRSLSLNYKVIFLSGRDEVCRDTTEAWLQVYYGEDYEALYMRPKGNSEKDSIVKDRLFKENVLPNYYIEAVFDDRNQVVKKWRELGLKCFQVEDGDF